MRSEWKEVKLKYLIEKMGDGGTPSTLNQNNFGGDIPWVVVEDIRPEIYDTNTKLTDTGFSSCSAKLWPIDSVILSTGATIGEVGIAKVPLCTKQGITGLVCNEFANNYYLKFWFEHNRNTLFRYSQGTTFKEIRPRPLGNLRIKIPSPLTKESVIEQKTIAGIISNVDEAIEAVESSIKAADRLKKSLMQNLLTGKLKPDGTWRGEDEFVVDEKFGKVPVGWTVKSLKDLILFHQYGMNISSSDSGTVPMFRMNNIIDGRIVDSPMVMVNISDSDFEKYKVEKGDILFNRTNSLELVGKIGIFEMEGDYVFASYLIRIRATEDNEPEYLNYYLNSYKGQTLLRAKATPAVSQANINAKSLVQTYVPRPPKETQTEIVQLIKSHEDIKLGHSKKLQALKTLKKSLMQNLLTGKIRVDVEKINTLLEEA